MDGQALGFETFVREAFSPAEVLEVVRVRDSGDWRFGQIAVRRGYVTTQQVISVVAGQAISKKPLGELLLKRGWLTPERVNQVLAIQENPYLQTVEALWMAGVVSMPETEQLRRAFEAKEQRQGGDERESEPPPSSGRTQTDPARVRVALKSMTELAVLPAIAQKVLVQLQDNEVKLDRVAKTLEGDQALTVRILRLVNSAFFANRSRVTTIGAALTKLGTGAVRQVVLTASVLERFSGSGSGAAMLTAWKDAILAGQWARHVGRMQGLKEQSEQALVGGLLSRVGDLVMLQKFRGAMVEIQRGLDDGLEPGAAERAALGMTLPEMGGLLVQMWNFGPELSEAVCCSRHTPLELQNLKQVSPVARAVNGACALARLGRGDMQTLLGEMEPSFFEFHGLSRVEVFAHSAEVLAEADKFASALL